MEYRALKKTKDTDRLQKLVQVRIKRVAVIIVMRIRSDIRRHIDRMYFRIGASRTCSYLFQWRYRSHRITVVVTPMHHKASTGNVTFTVML